MKRITISLDDDLHKALQQWAQEEDRSMSSLLSHLSRQALVRQQREQQPKAS